MSAIVSPSTSTKWADFLISAVRFNAGGTHLDFFHVHPDNVTSVGPATINSRADVVAAIRRGLTFVTIVKGADGKWRRGQPVYVKPFKGSEYLETVENKTAVDNLDNLPRF